MKIQIVYVEPEDDFGSIHDKLLWSKAARALLVWPGRGEALNNQLDLVLLKRAAVQQGIVIGLLTHDTDVQSMARKLSIPLFEDLDHLPESNWSVWEVSTDQVPKERLTRELRKPSAKFTGPQTGKQPAVRLGLLLLPLSLFLLGLILLAPAAVIEIYPPTLREIDILTFSLAERSDLTNGSVAYDFLELDAQGERRIPTTGTAQIADDFASGEVEFSNLSEDPVAIPAGTIVRGSDPDGPRFRTQETVTLLGGEGSVTTAGIIAVDAGPEGNVAAEMIDTLEGAIGLRINVFNPEPTQGGSSKPQAAVSANDLRRVREELEEQLKSDFIEQASQIITADQYLLENTLEIIDTIQETYDAEVGDVADSLQISLTQKARVIIINREDLRTLIAQSLRSDLTNGYSFAPDSPTILDIREKDTQSPTGVEVEVEVAVRTYQDFDEQIMIEELRGTSRTEAINLIQRMNTGGREPLIRITPSWYPWLPLLSHRIDIQLVWEETF